MGKATFSYNMGGSTANQAYLRNTCQAIHDGFIAAGLVQTADSGQLDFTTIPAPLSSDIQLGFRVYELIDELSSTLRFIVKVIFYQIRRGLTSPSVSEIFLRIEAGTDTDGSGSFIGDSLTVCTEPVPTSKSITKRSSANSFICAKPGIVNIAVAVGAFSATSAPNPGSKRYSAGFACIARTMDDNGEFDGRGITAISQGTEQISQSFGQMRMKSHSLVPGEWLLKDCIELCSFIGQTPGFVSINARPVLQHPMVSVPHLTPFYGLAMYPSYATYAIGDTFSVELNGQTRTLVALADMSVVPGISGGVTNANSFSDLVYPDVGLAMIWED